ncbi:uracil-DNA glycosylase [Polycyclovorans algicola]|uniref:uracil-DNA glycosylase n=1 Tax=Polycyclovorans algicola TaxID=616992 RepID=UPI0004A6F950|nr:uracil-DNA glycosylase [Polycyclovorans algicola]
MNDARKRRLARLGVDSWALRDGAPATAPTADVSAAAGPVEAAAPDRVTTPPPSSPPRADVRPPAQPSAAASGMDAYADWATLEAAVASCTQCGLCPTRTQTVFGAGARDAPLMIVGEGPGADEDASGLPFVGRAGKLLDEMLAAIDHSRERNVFIANVVKCRPPGNRDPATDEAEACRPYLEAQIALIKPRLIVALGRVAAQRLLATDQPLSRLRGPLHHYGPLQTPLLVTYHPAYLLRSPREKAKSWQDLKGIWQRVNGAVD